jgi:hypothetical protein
MRTYTPDCWVMLKFTSDKYPTTYKILAGWYGGYLNGDSWKLNSGITEIVDNDTFYSFKGSSGSVYDCHKQCYRMSGYVSSVFANFVEQMNDPEAVAINAKVELLPEDTNFMELPYA